MSKKKQRIKDLIEYKEKLESLKSGIDVTKGKKSMSGWAVALLIIAAIVVGLFLITFLVYMFNLDMKLMAAMEPILLKHYDKVERDEHL